MGLGSALVIAGFGRAPPPQPISVNQVKSGTREALIVAVSYAGLFIHLQRWFLVHRPVYEAHPVLSESLPPFF